jgi:DNA-binding transcriptional MocR family regulator
MAQRIVDALADAINQGQLAAGGQLPPHRDLADALGLSVGTVSRAYSIAKEQGLITGTVGRGTFVSARGDGNVDLSTEIDLAMNFIRWDPGESVTRQLFSALREQSDLRTVMEVYPTAEGRADHRDAAARWLGRRGLAATGDRVVITNGAQHGMLTVLAALAKPGDLIATENVTYPGIKAIASRLQLCVAGVPMDSEGLIPDALDRVCASKHVSVLYTIPTIQNPTGGLMCEERRRTIAALARRWKIAILEDDIYSFLMERPPLPIAAFAPERSYFVTSLSKSVLPGLRLGFVLCPPGGTEQVASSVRMSLLVVSPLAAAIGTRWLEDGTAERVIQWKRAEIESRWQRAVITLGLEAAHLHPAAHIWLSLPGNWQSEEFVARARARGVVLAGAEAFAVGSEPAPRAVRICLGVPSTRARLEQALQVIAELLLAQPAPVQLI